MEILEVDAYTYNKSIKTFSLFTSANFAILNQKKVETLYFLLFKDSKVRLGIILGLIHNELYSPFSSPYGGFSFVELDCKARIIDEAISIFNDWIIKKRISKVKIGQPPIHYDTQFQTRLINGLRNNSFKIEQLDVNHHFKIPSDSFEDIYSKLIKSNARKNLNNSLKKDLTFLKLTDQDYKRAYEVIAINRLEKQKPLRMSLDQILELTSLTQVDFFIVKNQNHDVASAIVFHLSKKLVQVVYWGDNPDFYELRAMNFLTFNLFKYYSQIGIQTIDIGISTENSIPNYGLCEFKESIGCEISLKHTFVKEYTH